MSLRRLNPVSHQKQSVDARFKSGFIKPDAQDPFRLRSDETKAQWLKNIINIIAFFKVRLIKYVKQITHTCQFNNWIRCLLERNKTITFIRLLGCHHHGRKC